jgi:hypothetical protein
MADASMAERELTERLAAFTAELRTVAGGLDPQIGWYAAFAQRSPEELDAWLAGRELPPWDALADLLQDLAVLRGFASAERTGWRLRELYEAAARAQDALPGGREALGRRLTALDQAEREARQRERQLSAAEENARYAGQTQEAERLATLLLWARDDEERVLARRAELHARLAARTAAPDGVPRADAAIDQTTHGQVAVSPPGQAPEGASHRAVNGTAEGAGQPSANGQAKGRRKLRGARFAGLADDAAPEQQAPPVPVPQADTATGPQPSGSRYAGAVRETQRRVSRALPSEEEGRTAGDTVARLRRLRDQGQSGSAHIVLCEAVAGPPGRLPALVAELERAGMASDLAALLWEAASLPPGGLAAAAEALAAAGRERDCEQLLRQGAARPAAEAGAIAVELWSAGRTNEAVTLLAALVRARTAEEVALAAAGAPDVVAPLLLDAARQVSPRHHYAVSSELRRAGVA